MIGGRAVLLRACCAAGALAAGCDYALRIDHISLHADGSVASDAAADMSMAADASQPCANPLLFDNFAGPDVCSPWGSSYVDFGATITEPSKLIITPALQANSIGGCMTLTDRPFGSGVTAVVSDVLHGDSTYTVLQVHGVELQIKASGDGMLRFQTSASQDLGIVTYQPAMKWWRIRPMGSTIVVGEYSTNGSAWSTLGAATIANIPANVGIEIAAGTNTATVIGTGTFEQLSICP